MFYDDTCVVPERIEGRRLEMCRLKNGKSVGALSVFCWTPGKVKQEGLPYQRRGSLQLWQFLLTLLDNPANGHLIVWTGRNMEFKLIDPEEVSLCQSHERKDMRNEEQDVYRRLFLCVCRWLGSGGSRRIGPP